MLNLEFGEEKGNQNVSTRPGWMLEFDECDGGLCEDSCGGLCEDPCEGLCEDPWEGP